MAAIDDQRPEATGERSVVRLTAAERQLRVGCSGWQYKHWRGDFYPEALASTRWFTHYAERFDTVEINNTFYRLPLDGTFAKWRHQAPPRFLYALKASRFLTHMKKLKAPEEPLVRLFERAALLGPHLGPVLYQLPPNFRLNLSRLEAFLSALPQEYRHTVEFRDTSWYEDRVFDLLQRYRVALCLHDMGGSATGRIAVGPFVYVRFHGTQRYGGRYGDDELEAWASWLAARYAQTPEVFVYFNNDIGGHAPRDARRLRVMLRAALGAAAPAIEV